MRSFTRRSLIAQGAVVHFRIALVLISVIPALVTLYLAGATSVSLDRIPYAGLLLALTYGVSPALGYVILSRYPRMAVRLRAYLQDMLHGELPERIALVKSEDDLSAIENSMNLILRKLKGDVATVSSANALLQEELVRVDKLRAIGTLAGGIAHEINTPLQIIRSHTEFTSAVLCQVLELVDQSPPGGAAGPADRRWRWAQNTLIDVTSAAQETEAAVERVAGIVTAMQSFASHGKSGTAVRMDLNATIMQALTITHNEWKHVVNVETDLAPDIPLVECYASDIKQGLTDLILNATRAVAERGDRSHKGVIQISTQLTGAAVTLQVRDTGVGIPQAIQNRIFDPFFTTREVGQGQGQALARLHSSIVNRHGGRIFFDSQNNQGTTFTIVLPLQRSTSP
ncbi:MAG: hypothetical protein K8T26_16925 [Lentisphaerae bacterium]|nr:hypothetical protein [Lentisphaerota bacterium]